jgi:flagellar biosynthesis protein FlhB
MADESGEKTEEPTDKKLQDSRKKGQVWKSRELTGVAVFFVGLGAVKASWDYVQTELSHNFAYAFDLVAHPRNLEQGLFSMMVMGVRSVLLLSLPVVGSVALVGGMVEFLQVRALFSVDPLIPKLDKLNPVNGFKNMFSKKQLIELIKSTLKISIAGYVVFGAVRGALGLIATTVHGTTMQSMAVLGELVTRVAARVGLLFLLFSTFDIWLQRRTYMKDLMMTKEEVKKEYKESEGDPHHKAKRKELHHEILEGAAMESVKGADVVVTNPDHVAVALRYERAADQAPRILAKGLEHQAEAIKAVAKAAGVPLLRNVPLAHALVRLDVGQEIPEELYDAVAEVLNFIYELGQGASHPASPIYSRANGR